MRKKRFRSARPIRVHKFVSCTACSPEFQRIQNERDTLLQENDELRRLVDTDALTSLPNRRALIVQLERAIARAKETEQKLAFVVIDIDLFKSINDKYGHDAGDEVLRSFSARLKKSCREDDFIARFGGEEFVMILPETDEDLACQLVETLRMRIENKLRVSVGGKAVGITASFGVAMLESESDTADTLFKRADEALYKAKSGGRNRVVRSRKVPEEN